MGLAATVLALLGLPSTGQASTQFGSNLTGGNGAVFSAPAPKASAPVFGSDGSFSGIMTKQSFKQWTGFSTTTQRRTPGSSRQAQLDAVHRPCRIKPS